MLREQRGTCSTKHLYLAQQLAQRFPTNEREIKLEGQRLAIDATFPGAPWDGSSPMPLACGPGEDIVVEREFRGWP
jgi:hypothetical protein